MQIKETKEKTIKVASRHVSFAASGLAEERRASDTRGRLADKKQAALPEVEDFLKGRQKRQWERLPARKRERLEKRMEGSSDFRRYQEIMKKEESVRYEKKRVSRFSRSAGEKHAFSEASYGRAHASEAPARREGMDGWERTDAKGAIPDPEARPEIKGSQKAFLLSESNLHSAAAHAAGESSERIIAPAADTASGGISTGIRYGVRAVKKAAQRFSAAALQKESAKKEAARQHIFAASSVTGTGTASLTPSGGAGSILAKAFAIAAVMVSAIVQAALLPILMIVLAVVILFAAVFGTLLAAITGASSSGNTAYLSWAISIAEDDSHGYSQGPLFGYETSRTGPDYDCSSFVYYALESAGYEMPGYAFTTASMPSVLTGLGFEQLEYTGMADLLPGDILWVHGDEVQHTEIYMGEGQVVGASGDLDGCLAGDQSGTGGEIRVGGFYENGWMGVFRDPNGGIGDIAIPEEYEGMSVGWIYTCTPHYGSWSWAYNQARVHAAWVEAGSVYSENVAMIDDKYLIACTDTFGQVGDWVTFYFEDGTAIETIIADQKSRGDDTWTPWGHIHGNQIDVIEAETFLTINPGQPGCVESWGGHRVVSATNHGAFI